jgi:hypothetical protein
VNNAAVVESAYKVLRAELQVPDQAGFCLKLVRLVVEDAYGMRSHEWYKWRTHPVERAPGDDDSPWARDMERSLRLAGMAVALPPENVQKPEDRYVSTLHLASVCEPGDLLFRWDVARTKQGTFVGHVGILMPGGMVLENVSPRSRLYSFTRGVTVLTPVANFPTTLAVRFDPLTPPSQ